MSTILAILSLPFEWLWNVMKAGQLRIRWERKYNALERLETLGESQLRALTQEGDGTGLVGVYLDDVVVNIGRAQAEPYVAVNLRLFNGSVYSLQFDEPKLTSQLDGDRLPLVSSLEGRSRHVAPGNLRVMHFIQPIQNETAERIRRVVEGHNQVIWEFKLESEFLIVEAEARGWINSRILRKLEIPIAR